MKEKISQEKVWDKIAVSWQAFRSEPLPEVIEFLKSKSGKVLDLSCGSGRHFVKTKNLEWYGVDFSKNMLFYAKKRAKEKNIKCILKKSDASKIPFKDNFFDTAIFVSSLHCIDSHEKRKASLKELFRVLKNGAEAMITVWSKNSKRVKNKPKESEIPWTIKNKKYFRYYYLFEKEELESLISEVGFIKIKSFENENIVLIVQKP